MNGQEFKLIRTHCRVTLQQVATESKLSRQRIQQIEKDDFIPPKYIKILAGLIDYDITNESKLQILLDEIKKKEENNNVAVRNKNFFKNLFN